MSSDSGFFEVHLQSLERFAAELEGQMDAMRPPGDRLAVLAGLRLPLGRFAEADALATRQAEAAQQMYGLLQAVREAVSFAGQVTRTVAAAYQRFDQQAAAAYGSPASAPGSGPASTAPGSVSGSPAGGPVQLVGVNVSVPQPVTVTVNGPGVQTNLPVTVTYSDPAQAPQAVTSPVPSAPTGG